MYQNRKDKRPKEKIKNFRCPKCSKNINRTLGDELYKDCCGTCGWAGKLCRTCGKEKRIRAFRKTKAKDGRTYKGAVPRFGYECKICKAEKRRKELEEARKKKRMLYERRNMRR